MKIILWALKGFLSAVGSIMMGIILLVIFAPLLTDLIVTFVLGLFVSALAFSGVLLDRSLRRKFNLSHTKMFSPLWTVISIIELSLFTVFAIVTILGLIPVSVLIYNIVIYAVLSIWILSHKIKKVSNFER